MIAENYRQKADELNTQWRREKDEEPIYKSGENSQANNFIFDGIANPDEWYKQDIRPLFILKEAYNKSTSDDEWNEIDFFLSNTISLPSRPKGVIASKYKTWRVLCCWASYIFSQNYDTQITWENENLRKIALINIKKYGGQNPSSNKDLQKHAKKHANLIIEQIKLIKPTIIICGYTGWLMDIVWEEIFKEKARKNKKNGRVYDIVIPEQEEIRLIDFWHPASRTPHRDDFIADIDAAMGWLPSPYLCSNEEPQNEDEFNECK